jgi:sulfur-oxidizing protein SoxX
MGLSPLTRIWRLATNPTSPRRGEVKKRVSIASLGASLLIALPGTTAAQALQNYVVVGDAVLTSLTGSPGDETRGRALVLNRVSTCILCHSGPFPEEKFQGDLAPNLSGSGGRWSEGQLRLRLVDGSRLNPATIMPSYYRVDGLTRVGAAWRDKPILSAEQIEDIVAYLKTLRE